MSLPSYERCGGWRADEFYAMQPAHSVKEVPFLRALDTTSPPNRPYAACPRQSRTIGTTRKTRQGRHLGLFGVKHLSFASIKSAKPNCPAEAVCRSWAPGHSVAVLAAR